MSISTHSFSISILILLSLTLFIPGCTSPKTDDSRAFLLKSDKEDLAEVSEQLIIGLSSQLEEANTLHEGYPILGHVELEPHPSELGVQVMRCTPGQMQSSTDTLCILLNEQGDFIRVQIVTWESAAFYMYRVYVSPKSLFAKVDPVKNFIGLDVFIFEQKALSQMVDESIREAAKEIGAHTFLP